METKKMVLERKALESSVIEEAADRLRRGELVAFPTETVYGLGADARNEAAIRKIFEVKGRPSDNPLILHIAELSELDELSREVSPKARALMEKFCPGPITFVVKRSDGVSDLVTAGLDSVAVRMPSDEIARALIRAAGCPIAAPSANVSGRPSPTDAEAVWEDLNGKIPLILDGGRTEVGLESTVVDVTGETPVILRPGKITPEEIAKVWQGVSVEEASAEVPRSPGQKYRHYAPKAKMTVFVGRFDDVVQRILLEEAKAELEDWKIGILCFDESRDRYRSHDVISLGSYFDKEAVSHNLYAALRQFDEWGVDVIFAETTDEKGLGLAIRNRMYKAAGGNVVEVAR